MTGGISFEPVIHSVYCPSPFREERDDNSTLLGNLGHYWGLGNLLALLLLLLLLLLL